MATKQPSLGDRYAEITVVLVTIIALAAGWFYKSGVENASVPFSAGGISAQAPKGWIQSSASGDELLRATDFSSSGFGTTYAVRRIAIAEGVTSSEIANRVTLEHAQNLTAFRILDQREVTVYGRRAFEISYVFVESNPDVTRSQLPRVALGADYVFLNGDHAIVVSFQADEKSYDFDLNRFHRFLQSLNF